MILALTGKHEKGKFEMLESPFSPSNHCFGSNKIDRSDVHNCPSRSASSTSAWIFTTITATNTIFKLGLFIPGKDSMKQCVKTGTSFVSAKIKVKQSKITNANLVIQTEHQDQAGGPFTTRSQLREMFGKGKEFVRMYINKSAHQQGCKLNVLIFQEIATYLAQPNLDLFASRPCH